MREFLKDKDLLKDSFQALAYFVFLAGGIKLALPDIQYTSWLNNLQNTCNPYIVFTVILSCMLCVNPC